MGEACGEPRQLGPGPDERSEAGRGHEVGAQSQLRAQRYGCRLPIQKGVRPRFHHQGPVPLGQHLATEAVTALQNDDLGTALGETVGRRKTGDAAADHGDATHAEWSLRATTAATTSRNSGSAFGARVRAKARPSFEAAAFASMSRS